MNFRRAIRRFLLHPLEAAAAFIAYAAFKALPLDAASAAGGLDRFGTTGENENTQQDGRDAFHEELTIHGNTSLGLGVQFAGWISGRVSPGLLFIAVFGVCPCSTP